VKDLTGLQIPGLSFLMGCTLACGSGGKLPWASKSVLELTNSSLPSLDYGTSSFRKIRDEEFGPFVFPSVTVHSARLLLFSVKRKHRGEIGVLCCCSGRTACVGVPGTAAVAGGTWAAGRGFDKTSSPKTSGQFCTRAL